MAWSASKPFTQFVAQAFNKQFDLDSDAYLVALFNNSITPANDVAQANSAYNVGQWGTANECYEAGQWAQGGVSLATPALTPAVGTSGTTTIKWDADDTASGSAADLTNATGALVYNNTLAGKYGVCYNYFGGPNSVVNGTFTVVWNANGIMSFSVA